MTRTSLACTEYGLDTEPKGDIEPERWHIRQDAKLWRTVE